MAVGMLVEAPGVNAEGYDSIMQNLDWYGKEKPQGFVSHYAGPTESGWLVFDMTGSSMDVGIVTFAAMIPLALLSTFIGLRIRGIPANLLSLGAMDFGIIVDGAVIVVENVFRKLSEGAHDRTPRLQKILDAAVEVGRPTLFSMLIIIAAHIPIRASRAAVNT